RPGARLTDGAKQGGHATLMGIVRGAVRLITAGGIVAGSSVSLFPRRARRGGERSEGRAPSRHRVKKRSRRPTNIILPHPHCRADSILFKTGGLSNSRPTAPILRP